MERIVDLIVRALLRAEARSRASGVRLAGLRRSDVVRRVAAVAVFVALAVVAWGARSPWTYRIREVEGALLLVGVLLGLVLARSWGARLVLALPLVVACRAEDRFHAAKARVLAAPPEQLARLGAHVVTGYRTLDEVRPIVEMGGVGGIFVTQRNIRGRTFREVQAELEILRASLPGDMSSLMIAADQEGGPVSRLSPMLTPLPPIATLVDDGRVDRARAREYARTHARDLRALGVDVNLAPVADLRLHDGLGALDAHTQLEDRAIAAEGEIVAEVVELYTAELARGGVSATLKHFPGLGRVREDTHLFDAELDAPRAVLEAEDWRPYRALAGRSDALVMVGHVVVPEVDPGVLSTFSSTLVDGVLRGELGFDGLVITDDLAMKPTYEAPGGIGESAVRALGAGIDLVLVAYDPDQWWIVMAALLDADDAGRIDAAKVAKSRLRRDDRARALALPEVELCAENLRVESWSEVGIKFE
ncbi:glycoside hydrolase family 3 protein [Myxococcota bacterium]|nr:glycoside hydrolase family 3 protein [Myxococcota bacterium]